MKSPVIVFILSLLVCGLYRPVQGQNNAFDIDIYKQFLQQHKNMSAGELMSLYPSGTFRESLPQNNTPPMYLDSIGFKYQLTKDEIELIKKHGFVVTERLQGPSCGERLLDIYHKDLPVFISGDAILHAFHCSYDRILKDIELNCLIPGVQELLNLLHAGLPILAERYSGNSKMQAMLHDVDLYLTIPRILLDDTSQPYFPANVPMLTAILQDIAELQPVEIALFSATPKTIDFSQFKPRGHYDDAYYTQLAAYFKAMIWLGRIEIYLIPPRSLDLMPTPEDMQRQVIDAFLISELVELAQAYPLYHQIESVLAFLVGDQDNVTLDNLDELKQELNINQASMLLDTLILRDFQHTLSLQPYAGQKILSQILMNDPCSPDSIIPASAFMLYGQRFIIDSYVTGNVVFDRIRYQGMAVTRMLPSTLDILFALGNDAAGQLLQSQLEQFHYAPNLSALRYLIDAYEPEFWYRSLHTMWLHAIRGLNPPLQRQNLPVFAQTAAWWQRNMNSQLCSWTELRHDHLLYAKQSYTGGVVCSYPYGYVEPLPLLFSRLKALGLTVAQQIQHCDFNNGYMNTYIANYFENLAAVCDTLQSISQKELSGIVFSDAEQGFLKNMIRLQQVCGDTYDGWYPSLFYPSLGDEDGLLKKNYLVADYHTAPTDEIGNIVGWVAHAGTGPVDMLILTAELPGNSMIAFIGPVMSYHEYTSVDFLRLTDDEWKDEYLALSLRPAWTNLYMCDNDGALKNAGPSLLTGIENSENGKSQLPVNHLIARCYPNPFNATTLISFTLPQELANKMVKINIYDIRGRIIKSLLNDLLTAGNYVVSWNGTNQLYQPVSSGIYFAEVRVGQERQISKLQLIR